MRNAKQAVHEVFDASGVKIALVVAQFNQEITHHLKESVLTRAIDYAIPKENADIFEVAGAIEIPLMLQQLARTKKYDLMIAIGCVIKGETPHFEYVCKFVSDGILAVQLQESMPIGFGVLTCNNLEEANARKDLGSDHLDAVLHQFNIIKNL